MTLINRRLVLCLAAVFGLPGVLCGAPPVVAQHVIVYYEPGRFAGWPANSGMWSWGNEILVCFGRAWFQEKADSHSYDRTRPAETVFARSLDGGMTWTLENETRLPEGEPRSSPGGIEFTHPDFALRVRNNAFHFSYDRGRTWRGPFALPDFGLGEITARTDYIVQGPADCLLFLSARDIRVQVAGEELKDRAFCARTRDGGQTFEFAGWMSDEPLTVRSVMPSTVRAADGTLVTTLRRRFDLPTGYRNDVNWIDAHGSDDDGRTWRFLARLGYTDTTLHNGNPPSLVRLPDGRLAAAWGVRSAPFGIHARVSTDNGLSWGPELVLRDDARKYDIGYCRSVVRTDGRIVTLYYHTTEQLKENHIAATIWSPPAK
ncbi:MAG: sialidase family protein [Opitutaceae bacterium]